MKAATLLIVLILSIGSTFGTHKKGITTEEEYLYMSKGYKIALESGLDIKKGYAIGEIYNHTVGIYTVEYKTFLKINENDTTEVGYIVKINAKTLFGTTIYWFGVPVGNQTLLDQFFATLYAPANESLVKPFFKSYAALKEVEKL